jgi:hypothetical protein
LDFVAFIDLDQSSMLNGFFLIVLDFQSALDFLGFSGTGCLVSPVCDFGGFSRFGFGFLMDLGFYWFFSRTVIFQVGY